MKKHSLDPYPIPKDKPPLYVNEPWLIDKSLLEYPLCDEPAEKDDNIRIYVPMDLNRTAILCRIESVIAYYGKATESNEAKKLVRDIIAMLKRIPDGCAECFPFDIIDELEREYLLD